MLLLCRRSPRHLSPTFLNRHSSAASTTKPHKPFYVTTPIFYPNASPHIGHLYSLVTADVFARYERLKRGHPSSSADSGDVRFLAGTDEHGMKIQKAARLHFGEGGKEKQFCDTLSERFRGLGKTASISNTCFTRTSSDEHKKAVEDVWRKLDAKGYIYKSQYSGWYSITDECFYTDSQVVKTLDGQTTSVETGAAVEWSSEENYMFRLSVFGEDLLKYYSENTNSVYPQQYRHDVLQMLGSVDGKPNPSFTLADISISRPRSRLEWGVQVPEDPTQTVYVWFDALLIYLTGAGYPWTVINGIPTTPGWEAGWPANIQVIGKDILKFHAIYLPAIILGLSAPSKLISSPQPQIPFVHTILTHAHWTASQKKMSKSLGNVADPLDAIKNYGVDVVRFYLMRVGGRWRDDVDWSTTQLHKNYQEITAQLGNYLMRISSPALSARITASENQLTLDRCISEEMRQIFRPTSDAFVNSERALEYAEDKNAVLMKEVRELPGKYHACMASLEVSAAVEEVMAVLKLANKVMTDIAPWKSTTPAEVVQVTRITAFETLRVTGTCLEPVMPLVGEKIREALNSNAKKSVLGLPHVEEDVATFEENGQDALKVWWDRWSGWEVVGVRLFEQSVRGPIPIPRK